MKTKSLLRKILTCGVLLGLSLQTWPMAPQISVPNDSRPAHSQMLPGESATLLPSGNWLLLGGEEKSKPVSTAMISDPHSGAVVKLRGELSFARTWHTATLLPDGKVLVLGGNGSDGQVVKQAEIFDPSSLTFRLATIGLVPRAHHAAVLLTDGRLLIAGGIDSDHNLLNTVETWDERNGTSIMEAQLPTGRRDDQARLLADGTALFWGGADDQGNLLSYGELYDPSLNRFVATTTVNAASPDLNVPALEASIPENGATDVPLDVLIGLRFSKLLRPETVTSRSVSFQGPSGSVPALIVPAESGRLTFITPKSPLQPGTKYTLTLQGATDGQGLRLAYKVVTFTTVKEGDENASSATTGTGIDNAAQALAPLQAQPGVTAIAGQTLTLDSKPLQNVTFRIDDKAVRSDRAGRFLLTKVVAGHHAMVIDGRTASRPGHTYGVFEVGVDLLEGSTTVLP